MEPYPIYIRSAKGSRLIDVDGNEYIDLVMGGGPNLLGHCPAPVVEAVKRQLEVMTNPLISTELEIELVKRIKQHMPHMEMIRFTNTGSEGTRTAVRVARAYTGRDKIAKFEGNYHGSDDYFLFSGLVHDFRGPDSTPETIPDCAGIPAALRDEIVILPYNDAEATERLLESHSEELAAVILEPVAFSTGGGVPAEKEFLETVRRMTAEREIVLVFDEVVVGFRLAMGGAAECFGVTPDLSVVGKALGGGFPIGALGGRREIMEVVAPAKDPSEAKNKIFHSGTFTGNPVSMAAAMAMLSELEKGQVHPHIDDLGERLRMGLRAVFDRRGVDAQVTGIGSIYQAHFADHSIRNRRDILRSNLALQKEFCFGLTAHGVMQPPGHPGVVSAAHTHEEIEQIIMTADTVLQEMGLA
jgi:glutamate-1-semialdehyde 2,1-aminomutase